MSDPLPLSPQPTMIVIGDRVEPGGAPDGPADWARVGEVLRPWRDVAGAPHPPVTGGYLERLPLACIATGIVEQAEVWHHRLGHVPQPLVRTDPRFAYRAMLADGPQAPIASREMLDFVRTFGAPHILVVLGLGVSTELLEACANGVRIYNSIDAPALRVPPEASAHFDIVLTGAPWQSMEVAERHPAARTLVLPIGPEFAATDLFRPLDIPKDYDLIYVAAAQGYKRHDILFDALDRCPRDVRALCVFGYGEMADDLRREAAARGLNVDFTGPPGVPFDEVNRLMNRARFGVVCGRDDGAPAILTEYMLAGLPVLANADLACGTHYILPETGLLASPEDFAGAIMRMRATWQAFRPREAALARWTWWHSIERLRPVLAAARAEKFGAVQHGSIADR